MVFNGTSYNQSLKKKVITLQVSLNQDCITCTPSQKLLQTQVAHIIITLQFCYACCTNILCYTITLQQHWSWSEYGCQVMKASWWIRMCTGQQSRKCIAIQLPLEPTSPLNTLSETAQASNPEEKWGICTSKCGPVNQGHTMVWPSHVQAVMEIHPCNKHTRSCARRQTSTYHYSMLRKTREGLRTQMRHSMCIQQWST